MHVVFLHGPAAAGKHTVGTALSALSGWPLFHNHLAVDAAKALFAFGTPAFNHMRATVWRTAFAEAAASGVSFVFTFHPEASVDPALIDELLRTVAHAGGRVHFIELRCAPHIVLRRLGDAGRARFGKLTDPVLYRALAQAGAFRFPALPAPLLVLDTGVLSADAAAAAIARAVGVAENAAGSPSPGTSP